MHLIAKNRITQYMGSASAYGAVLRSIETEVMALQSANPGFFTFTTLPDGSVDIRDF